MGQTPEDIIHSWLTAAGKDPKTTGPVRERITLAGNFLLKTARMSNADVCDSMKGIDFSKAVIVLNAIPDRVYVQYVSKYRGHWFTTTGLTPDVIGIDEGLRTRTLFRPSGSVCALQSFANGIRDYWTADKLFKWPEMKDKWAILQAQAARRGTPLTDAHAEALYKRLGTLTQGGGTQYFIPDPSRMTPL